MRIFFDLITILFAGLYGPLYPLYIGWCKFVQWMVKFDTTVAVKGKSWSP